MILLVDVGNTRTKWRILNDCEKYSDSGVILNEQVSYDYLDYTCNANNVKKIFLSCVGKESILKVFDEYAQISGLKLHLVKPEKSMNGVDFVYENIDRLGVDRCLAMIGAYTGVGVLVIDAGSAITADYVSDRGVHLGGYILPGYRMCRGALLGKTAKIGVVTGLGCLELGRNTEDCVNNGFALMFRAIFLDLIEFAKSMGISRFVLTGGDAKMLEALSPQSILLYENLVLDGLEKYALDGKGAWGNEV